MVAVATPAIRAVVAVAVPVTVAVAIHKPKKDGAPSGAPSFLSIGKIYFRVNSKTLAKELPSCYNAIERNVTL